MKAIIVTIEEEFQKARTPGAKDKRRRKTRAAGLDAIRKLDAIRSGERKTKLTPAERRLIPHKKHKKVKGSRKWFPSNTGINYLTR